MHRRQTAWYGVLPVTLAGLLAACGDGGSDPSAAACTAANSFPATLDPGEYVVVDPITTEGCVLFAANPGGGASVEYLVVPQTGRSLPW